VWEDGSNDEVRVRVSVDSDNEVFVYYEVA
jgi:hypothetical protein